MAIRDYRWFQKIKPDFDAVTHDEFRISRAAGRDDLGGVLRSCHSLRSNVVTLQADPAAPDPAERRDLSRALSHYSTAATYCLTEDFRQSADETRIGTTYMQKAARRVTSMH